MYRAPQTPILAPRPEADRTRAGSCNLRHDGSQNTVRRLENLVDLTVSCNFLALVQTCDETTECLLDQVSIQLKPSAVRVDTKIRLPTTVREEDEEDEDDDDESTSWSAVGSDVEDGVEDETDGSSSYFETETDTDDNDET